MNYFLEEYRFTFLQYLGVAHDLLNLDGLLRSSPLENLKISLNREQDSLYAELSVLYDTEKMLWKRMLSFFKMTQPVISEPIWFSCSAKKHHGLLINDEFSFRRVECYIRELKKFDKTPKLPSQLESYYRSPPGVLSNLFL